jgi:hypothetical protein
MRFRFTLRRRRTIGLALAACSLALVVPAAVGASATGDTDGSTAAESWHHGLPSPDERAAALAAEQPPASIDLRSPDARDAASAAAQPPASIDLRSPDARDAARAAASGTASEPVSAVPAQPTVVSVVEDDSQTLAIVLSSVALFLALVAVGFAALYRRPRPRWSASS